MVRTSSTTKRERKAQSMRPSPKLSSRRKRTLLAVELLEDRTLLATSPLRLDYSVTPGGGGVFN
jgi:hypothetical protein